MAPIATGARDRSGDHLRRGGRKRRAGRERGRESVPGRRRDLTRAQLRWRGVDKPTNVLSFPSAPPGPPGKPTTLGDIALAYETLVREAGDLGLPLADHYRHLLAHGFLHLVGYDHETDAEAERMEALETRILARLGASDPYAREVVGG